MARKIVVVAGPTATGKTRLGIALSGIYGGEIVSADSMQIYRRMDIGTAKADEGERAAAVHHMIDVAEPGEAYSVARYVQEAERCCEDIFSRGRLPIVVGGTGLYIESLLSGRDFAEKDENSQLRARLSAEYAAQGGEALLSRLRAVDPERADILHAGDKRRIVRALEIFLVSGETITQHDRRTKAIPPRYEAARIILSYEDRSELYRRIDSRVDAMVEKGLFREVEGLLDAGLSQSCTAMQAIGYKEAALALSGKLSREDAVALIKQRSRRYAKRQLTWFGRDKDALWIRFSEVMDFSRALQISTEYLNRFGIS